MSTAVVTETRFAEYPVRRGKVRDVYDLGHEILHLYVDGLWVRKEGCKTSADFEALLAEIMERTGLPISLDGVYRWVVFLPSRVNQRVPVANRYFGVFQDGSVKVRGSCTPVYRKPSELVEATAGPRP